MQIYYHKTVNGNVGDDMNAVLWRRLLPEVDVIDTAEWLIGAGTILDGRLQSLPGRKLVLGSGFRPGAKPESFAGTRIAAVRGYLTATECGLPDELAICDPGFLAARVWPQRAVRTERIGFVPHIYSEQYSHICAAALDAGLDVISPTLDIETFLARLASCTRIYTESLHGAIFADALRVPWARIRACAFHYEGAVADFKWIDTFSVFDTPTEPLNRTGLLPVKRSWSAMQTCMRPIQAIAERRLIRALLEYRDDADAFRLSHFDRVEERGNRLWERTWQLAGARFERFATAAPAPQSARQQVLRVLAFPKFNDNPYLETFANSLEEQGASVEDFVFWRAWLQRYDVVHMHWPDTHLRTHSWWRAIGKHVRLLLTCLWLRARGTRIVWMMHNLQPHEKDHWISARLFPVWFPRVCTQVMALTHTGLSAAWRLYPELRNKPSTVVRHGHYRRVYPRVSERGIARRTLGINTAHFTFLFFGAIRRYKNVPHLIRTFRELADRDVQLVIAGRPVLGMKADELHALAAGDERIHLHLQFIPDDRVPLYLAAADQVVLPFDSILNSGSVLLALSLNRPVLAPALGALPELQAQVGERWLELYDGTLTAAHLHRLRHATDRPIKHEAPDLGAFEWEAIARTTLEFYRSPLDVAAAADGASTPSLDAPSAS